MERNISPTFRKWMKKSTQEEFGSVIEKDLTEDQDTLEIAQEIINSKEMTDFLTTIKIAYHQHRDTLRFSTELAGESRPQTSMSLSSDLSCDEWNALKYLTDQYSYIINKISCDKPVHVRLAGYETLLKSELTNAATSQSWDVLLKTLRDGIADGSRAIFDSSLKVHSKLLNTPQSQEVYTNLISAFNAQYHSKKLYEVLPSLTTGINFKIFLHEKLCRIMNLIIRHQEEILKGVRNVDKTLEEMIEQFIVFLSSQAFGNSMQTNILNTLHVVSILEPQANWSKKWIHSLATRKTLMAALAKSPSLIQHILMYVRNGLTDTPTLISVTIVDEPAELLISGETVKTMTYLHCLSLLGQLCSNSAGRKLLTDTQLEQPFLVSDFILALLDSLNILAANNAPHGSYQTSCNVLRQVLDTSEIQYDARFYHLTLNPLLRPVKNEPKIWPHTLDIMTHMLDTKEGFYFMTNEYRKGSASLQLENSKIIYPIVAVLEYTCNLIRQPFSVMNVEHVLAMFKFLEKVFEYHDIYTVVQDTIRNLFYPVITYLYNKMDKYYVENEKRNQLLDSAAKSMLLKITTIPLGLEMLAKEKLVFEDLIRGSLTPLRISWISNDIMAFTTSAALLNPGYKIVFNVAPHALSPILSDVCKTVEDPLLFHDPWDNFKVKQFLHILKLISLNTKCFIAFVTNTHSTDDTDDDNQPTGLWELMQHAVNFYSTYHCLGLLTLKEIMWNMDIYIYLQNALNIQMELLKLQGHCAIQIEEEGQLKTVYALDECSFLRHEILLSSYYMRPRQMENIAELQECTLFSKLPPPEKYHETRSLQNRSSHSELNRFLQESKPGLRDNNWVTEARRAHRDSRGPFKSSVIMDLLDEMQKAIPMAEWTADFKWPTIKQIEGDLWSPEENQGVKLTLHYAEQNHLLESSPHIKENMKIFFRSAHNFVRYKRPDKFQGFDWFLATVFIICNGNMEN
ncbi:protein broad-minded isoform X2 [Cephus cinctus]|uniref:Protein broad-minded isoform X2 n=1 Tax=Cephus cinctus TaxID=211228 RepID=A0AAJ7W5Y3_CEPCN|nr:protein broad-minded isoform X2 [Cephus cinctus]